MSFTRLGLQGKIIAIIAATVILVVGVSTYIAMWLTRLPVEEEIYRKALQQARLTAYQLADKGALQNPQDLLSVLGRIEHDLPGVRQSDVFLHSPRPHLVTTTNPRGEHLELDLRARVASRDEIGELAEHLNLMLACIENFSSELARKVEEATRELALRNEELKRINQELFETQKNLARSERLAVAGQLAASLAHEIGTPLNSISGHVQLLARRKALDDVSQRRLQIIENQIENIVRTVKQLLSWTRK